MALARRSFAALPLAAIPTRLARAQAEFPSRNIRFIVPFPPGGASDLLVRIVAVPLGERLGRPVVAENRGGAGTTIGTLKAARAPADGHTILLAALPFVINQFAMPGLPYGPSRDVAPVALLATGQVVLVARNGPGLPRERRSSLTRREVVDVDLRWAPRQPGSALGQPRRPMPGSFTAGRRMSSPATPPRILTSIPSTHPIVSPP